MCTPVWWQGQACPTQLQVCGVTKVESLVSLVGWETGGGATEIISETNIGHIGDAGGDAGLVTDKEPIEKKLQ